MGHSPNPSHGPTMRLSLLFLLAADLIGSQLLYAQESSPPDAERLQFVRAKVLPLLEARCFECHKDSRDHRGGLLLTSRKAMLRGGDSGPAIVPGKPDESLLIEAIRYEGFEMPPRNRMPEAEVRILESWVQKGAPWPADLETAATPEPAEFPLQKRKASHWAWQPIRNPEIPTSDGWGKDSLDGFLHRRLKAAELSPAPDADRHTLIRRLYFDLIGLPPTPQQIEAFVTEQASDDEAIDKAVDELLASPHFGERWGRHWLDLVRYAETLGHEFDYPLHHAWRYRDYIIRAFNADVPYDQLLQEHVAGDLLSKPRRHPDQHFNESIIGTGFWFLHEEKHAPVDVRAEEAAKIDNQIDVLSKTFLGLTVACARCHDHKFDAISTQDYYALAGYLQSSRRRTAWLDPHQKIATQTEQLRTLRRQALDAAMKQTPRAELLQRYAAAAVDIVRHLAAAKSESASGQSNEPPAEAVRQTMVTKYASESELAADVLQRWVDQLQDVRTAQHDDPMSLPAALAQQTETPEAARSWIQRNRIDPAQPESMPQFAEFSAGLPEGWFAQGPAFADEPVQSTRWSVGGDGLRHSYQAGVNSAQWSHELHGSVSSPTFELAAPEILVRVAGQNTRMRLIIDGYEMFEFNALLFNGMQQKIDTDGDYRWLRFSGDTHRYQGHRVYIEFLDEGDGWFDLQEIRFPATAGQAPPEQRPSGFNRDLALRLHASDEDPAATTALLSRWAQAAADNLVAREALLDRRLLPESQPSQWTRHVKRWIDAATAIPKPVPVIAIADGTPENESVFIRGNHRNLGKEAPRQMLTALRTADAPTEVTGSGRLQLAQQMIAPDNPLVARVAVNRIWHHLFGRGIVESTDNFGVLGKSPTHPELLDHLAVRFREGGWSTKAMIRAIVTSRAYRMSSRRTEAGERIDPTNALLHRANVRRLQGEAVRDAILTVSGRLDPQLYGAPVPIRLNSFLQGRGRPRENGPVDGNGRRSIYLSVYRNFLNPFMLAFDVPPPVTTTGSRTVSNVPAQALILLNNEFVNQQARLWADRLLQQSDSDRAQELLQTAWLQLLGRPATEEDLQPLLEFAGGQDERISKPSLSTICHVLLNSKEFLFLR